MARCTVIDSLGMLFNVALMHQKNQRIMMKVEKELTDWLIHLVHDDKKEREIEIMCEDFTHNISMHSSANIMYTHYRATNV